MLGCPEDWRALVGDRSYHRPVERVIGHATQHIQSGRGVKRRGRISGAATVPETGAGQCPEFTFPPVRRPADDTTY